MDQCKHKGCTDIAVHHELCKRHHTDHNIYTMLKNEIKKIESLMILMQQDHNREITMYKEDIYDIKRQMNNYKHKYEKAVTPWWKRQLKKLLED